MRQHFSYILAVAGIAAVLATPCAADEGDGLARFEIARFQIDGNTLLDSPFLDQLLAPYAGKAKNFGDVQRALEALEAAYQQRGYNVVKVVLPEQELNHGVVRMQVLETRIGSVRVEGNTSFDEANIRASLPGLREGEIPNLGRLSSSLKLTNANPAKKTTLRLQGGARLDEVNAVIKVEDEKPWRIAASIDNSGSRTTGKTQLTTQFQHANVGGVDHVMSLQYSTTIERPSQVSVYGAGYHIPLYRLGDSVDLFAVYSDVDAGSVLAGIQNVQLTGQGTVLGARYNHNLRRIGNLESVLTLALDHKAFRNSILSDVTVHPLSLAYTGAWTSDAGSLGFGLTAIRNIPGGSNGRSDDFAAARAGAPAGFRVVRFSGGYAHTLGNDWQARLVVAGQWSPDALISGELFGAGGHNTVRGFGERAIAGDTGHLVSAEIYTPNLCSAMQTFAMKCRALGFLDAAHVRRHHAQPGDPYAKASIGSVGLGVRMNIEKNLTLQMDVGHVLDGGDTRSKGDSRLHVKLAVSY
jgi:hemolysin activation/secretion protein